MAATYTSEWQQIAQECKGGEDYRKNVQTAWPAQELVIIAAGDQGASRAAAKAAGVAAFRAAQASAMSRDTLKKMIDPVLQELGRVIKLDAAKKTDDSIPNIANLLRRYMIDNPDSLSPPSRATSRMLVTSSITSPIPGKAAVVGTGTILLLEQDEDGFPLEARAIPDTLKFLCDKDRQNGLNPGQESFRVTGYPFDDEIDLYNANKGSGSGTSILGKTADDTAKYFTNPSFNSPLTASAIPGWDILVGVIGDFALDTTNYYRASNQEGTTPGSLQMSTESVTIRQKFSAKRVGLDVGTPLFVQVAFNAQVGAATGTLVLSMGNATVSVAIDGLAGWQVLRLPLDKTAFFKNFDTGDVDVRIAWTRTGGSLRLDDQITTQWDAAAGVWVVAIGGGTNFLYNDSFYYTLTEGLPTSGVPGSVQRVFGRVYQPEFKAGLPSVNPPPAAGSGALAGAGAGNVDNGNHEYVWVIRSPTAKGGIAGYVSAVSNTVAVADKTVNGKVTVTNPSKLADGVTTIPTGYLLDLYRAKAGALGTWYLLSQNVTAGGTYTDNTADSGLTTQPTFKSTATQPQDV